ncbi:DNA-binding transcriptional regulator of sugar metabolism, DeoR/GlpR family [Pelosinus fermentans]|uniref:DeoR/GlpR family DNA-binding transcription regulator n=1 Tax=Pelosinus fermentans TaxID=365349 RepID=UPI000268463D|nr:DeoR/GlpR family DNA-binding transcription regulator [Pelosinus fermentans]OAM92525.1 transcriptional regulator, DeoR family [Pelosinus fermentans DSM 17108]SDQ47756.1 DNA-binding transcriptional regulator of sugar metabolism, DeoR/GlpR family [Pelosinus fermentans]
MYSVERKSEIITMLEETGSVDVNVLAVKFATSKETIRRDLRDLEKDGVLKRTHGGAVLVEQSHNTSNSSEYPVGIREIQRFNEKNQICKKAASFIQEGDTIFVDNSSTTIYLSKYIPPEIHVTIITNSIKFLLESIKSPNYNHLIICLGGIFKDRNLSVYGNGTLKSAEEYYPNKAFLSCAGISSHNMLADSSIHEIDVKRMMIEHAQEVFILADHTKFQKGSQIFLSSFSAIDYIITDTQTDKTNLEYLDATNVKLIVAD